jgi:hypothetical protein
MPTSAQSEAAAALGQFWLAVKANQPEIEWHYENTKMMVAVSPVEYEGKQYVPGQILYPDSTRAAMFVKQKLARLVFRTQTTRKKDEIIPLGNLARPPASAEGMPLDQGTVEVFFPNYYPESYHYDRGSTVKLPAFLTWLDVYEETESEIKPNSWDMFVRCSILKDTDHLRAFVPLPWPWPLSRESYQFFLNKPTVHRVGHTIEGIEGFTFGNQEGALLAFNPQIPAASG